MNEHQEEHAFIFNKMIGCHDSEAHKHRTTEVSSETNRHVQPANEKAKKGYGIMIAISKKVLL